MIPKTGEYYIHNATKQRIFITAVGVRNVLATEQCSDGIQEYHHSFRELRELYDREETKES